MTDAISGVNVSAVGTDPMSRRHLFVSYATSNATFAMWLARKLAAEGYLIWMDRLKLLGGQIWPAEIDEAIRERSFLMLALMSTVSVKRDNPRGEWTLGLEVAKKLGRDFVIPVRVDRFEAKELGFLHINRQYIDFSTSWVEGFRDLLKTLRELNVPAPAANGRAISAGTFMPDQLVVSRRERLIANFIRFSKTPPTLLQYASSRRMTEDEWAGAQRVWAFRALKRGSFLAIAPPPAPFAGDVFKTDPSTLPWDKLKTIHDIDPTAFMAEMLRKAVTTMLVGRGFALDEDDRSVYLATSDELRHRISYQKSDGSRGSMAESGRRTFRAATGERRAVFYRLGFRLTIEEIPVHGWGLIPKLFLRLRGENDSVLSEKTATSRRRAITRNWWNDKQLDTHFAFLAVAGAAQDALEAAGVDCGVRLDLTPIEFSVERAIDESRFADGSSSDESTDEQEIEEPAEETEEAGEEAQP